MSSDAEVHILRCTTCGVIRKAPTRDELECSCGGRQFTATWPHLWEWPRAWLYYHKEIWPWMRHFSRS